MAREYEANITDTIIGTGVHLKGRLRSDNNLVIDGAVEGNVSTSGMVSIGVNGRIEGNVNAQIVNLAGIIIGDVTCKGHLSVADTGQLQGNIKTTTLEVATGAILIGMVTTASRPTENEDTTEESEENKSLTNDDEPKPEN